MDHLDSSSDESDELLADIKRKRISDEQPLCDNECIPEHLLKVEIEEVSDHEDNKKDVTTEIIKQECETIIQNRKRRRKNVFECTVCEVEFSSKEDKEKHIIEHQVQTRHKCDECGRCFPKAFYLRNHKKMHEKKTLSCVVCGQSFSLKLHLGRHMLRHEKSNQCTDCEKSFYTKTHLEKHKIKFHLKIEENSFYLEDNLSLSTTFERDGRDDSHSTNELLKTENSELSDSKIDDDESYQHKEIIENISQLSYEIQCAIVSKMHKGRNVPDICSIYNVSPDIVNQIWENRDFYIVMKKAGRKSIKYMNSILDAKVLDWVNARREQNLEVTGKLLVDFAESTAKETGFPNFNGSKKWLERFKMRYKIAFRTVPFKRGIRVPNESKWKTMFLTEQWPDIREGYNDDQIYSADEVGLFYNPSKGRIKKLGGKKYIQGFPQDRFAIFICSNMTGSDKKRLFVCGAQDPLQFSNRNPDTLPAIYIRHPEAHFTTLMFEEYVKFWNKELQATNSRAVLILDRATIHSKLVLSHLKLVFVPWKTSTSLIPVKNGLFAHFRNEYRRLILQDKVLNCFKGVDRHLTCLEALNLIEKAWLRTPSELISKCFETVGFNTGNNDHKPVYIPKHETDELVMSKLLQDYDVEEFYTDLVHLENYLTVDEEFVLALGTNCSVFGGNHKNKPPKDSKPEADMLPIGTAKPDSDLTEKTIMKARALDDLEIVKKYLQTNNTEYDIFGKFFDVEKFVLSKCL